MGSNPTTGTMYRLNPERPTQIQRKLPQQDWGTVYYCATQERAEAKIKELEIRQEEWDKLTPHERLRQILRDHK